MAMQAAKRAVSGHVTALGVAVTVLRVVRADDAGPALRVRAAEHHALIGQPRQHVISSVVRQADGREGQAVSLSGRDAQSGADVV